MKHGLHCLGCAAANMETISDAAVAHSIDIDELISDLNSHLKDQKNQ